MKWKVTEAGYSWEKPKGVGKQVPILVARRAWPSHDFDPAQRPGLFREFLSLPTDRPGDLLAFAGRNGHLGGFVWIEGSGFDPARAGETDPLNRRLAARHPGGAAAAGRDKPETLSLWTSQIQAMRGAHDTWEGVRTGRADPGLMGSVAEAVAAGCAGRVKTRFGFDPATRRCGWVNSPLDLLGALWLQLADAITSGKELRPCAACGRWFEVAPGTGRSDKQHCSVACRQKAYRGRQLQAVALHQEGMSATEIAHRLNSDIKSVRGWLKGVGKGQSPGGEETGPHHRRGLDL